MPLSNICSLSDKQTSEDTPKMKLILVLCIGTVLAAPPNIRVDYQPDNVQILRYENDDLGEGSYRFDFEQSDGTIHRQQGELKNKGQEDELIVMRGEYSWTGPDGITYTVGYIADENGFVPQIAQGEGGAIPEEVIRTIGRTISA